MSCSPFDLRDYFLQELPDPQQRLVEAHVKTCQPCREELDRLDFTKAAMFSLQDEEIPQRIAFVSDKIFEPSPWRRWWAGFWGSASRLGFASAAMLSTAIVVYALRPAPHVVQLPAPAPQQIVQKISDEEIQARVDAAVVKAVAEVEARQSAKTQHLVADLQSAKQQMVWAASELVFAEKRSAQGKLVASGYGLPDSDARREPK
jgi:anti-sigma factor RsiW